MEVKFSIKINAGNCHAVRYRDIFNRHGELKKSFTIATKKLLSLPENYRIETIELLDEMGEVWAYKRYTMLCLATLFTHINVTWDLMTSDTYKPIDKTVDISKFFGENPRPDIRTDSTTEEKKAYIAYLYSLPKAKSVTNCETDDAELRRLNKTAVICPVCWERQLESKMKGKSQTDTKSKKQKG